MESIKYLNSPTKGQLTFAETLQDLKDYMLADQKRKYTIVIGTDSNQNHTTDFVTAIVIHRVGAGGRYFWVRKHENLIPSLRQRIYQEALRSLAVAEVMTKSIYEFLREEKNCRFNVEIHVDIGENGPTREMIKEVVGMIRGNGFEVKTKPAAYGAFVVADRHT